MPDWIDVNDQLPDDYIIVLAHFPRGGEPVWLAYQSPEGWRCATSESVVAEDDQPSHWMPLPEAPQ